MTMATTDHTPTPQHQAERDYTYTVTVGGEDTTGLTAPQAEKMATEADRCGLPWMITLNTDPRDHRDGCCVGRGNGMPAKIDMDAAEVYDIAIEIERRRQMEADWPTGRS